MTTKGRGGSRPRRAPETTIERAPAVEPEPIVPAAIAPETDAQLLDDRTRAIGGTHGLRLGRSFASAVVGTVLVVGLAFGAALGPGGVLGPSGERPAGDTTALTGDAAGHGGEGGDGKVGDSDGTGGDGTDGDWIDPEATAKPDPGEDGDADPTKDPGDEVEPTDKPDQPDPTQKPAQPDPTKKPAPESTPKPTEKPDPTKDPTSPIALELAIRDYHPKMAWGSCDGLDFDYYKVVRSSDSTVSWPAGDGDEVFAVVERGGERRAWDKHAPHGDKAWYRVFCVRKTDSGYKVVNASATKGIEVPEEPAPPPSPDPVDLSIDFSITDGGKVVLTWSACDVEGFAFYKVVKSTWNDNPSYLPWTDGSEVIGVVSDAHATEWHDWAPESGETAYYRIQCIGYWGDQKVLLGQTAVVTVTAP